MSFPPNPLDKYRTHSYHHFLFAANTTNVVRAFMLQNDSEYTKLTLGEQVKVSGVPAEEKMFMMVNPFIESNVFIDSLKYKISLNMSPQQANSPLLTTPNGVGDLEMVIQEPRGVVLMNRWREITQKLEATHSGVTYVLMTVFVGHTHTGTTEYLSSGGLLMLTLQDFKSAFTHMGGMYSLKFSLSQYGAPQQFRALGMNHRNYTAQAKDGTLLSALKDYQKKFNDDMTDEWVKAGNVPGAFKNKKLQIQITIPAEWSGYMLKTHNADNALERDFRDPNRKAVDWERDRQKHREIGTFYDAGAGKQTIESVITSLVQKTPEVFANFERGGMPHHWKIESAVTSDKDTYTVHYDVVEVVIPEPPKSAGDEGDDTPGLILDYIFTGDNLDIMNYAMEIDGTTGYIFVNYGETGQRPHETHDDQRYMSASKPTKGITEQTNKDRTPGAVGANAKHDPQTRTEQHDAHVNSSNVHAVDIRERRKYLASVAAYTSSAVLNATVTIRGNPALYNQMLAPVMPHGDGAYEAEKSSQRSKAEAAAAKMKSGAGASKTVPNERQVTPSGDAPTMVPLLVKIRAKTPVYNDAGLVVKTEPFWYEGWFQCLECETAFAGGTFTQTLKLVALLGG